MGDKGVGGGGVSGITWFMNLLMGLECLKDPDSQEWICIRGESAVEGQKFSILQSSSGRR